MRRLLILRHAKTERTNLAGDHARILIDRGREDAERMGEFLAHEGLLPDHALVSDAARTVETFQLLARGMGTRPQAQILPSLYLAAPPQLLDAVRTAPDSAATVLVVAHNPGIHQFAYDMGQRGPHKLVSALAARFPTCALAVIDCDIENWTLAHATTSRISRFMTAKALRLHQLAEADDDC